MECKLQLLNLPFLGVRDVILIPELFVFQIDHLENEISLLRQSEGSNVIFKGVDLPDGIAPSSANIINSLNEYLIHILQVLKFYM